MKKMLEKTLDFEMAMPLNKEPENLMGDSLESLLVKEEKVFWKGMPSTELLERPEIIDYSGEALSYFSGFLAFVWFAFFRIFPSPRSFSFYVLMTFLSLVLFLLYLGIIYIPQWIFKYTKDNSMDKRGRIRYFYTNQKIIFKIEKTHHFIPFGHIKKITFTSTREGHGTIYFIIKKEFKKKVLLTKEMYHGTTRHSPTFELIPDVANFHKELVKVFSKGKD